MLRFSLWIVLFTLVTAEVSSQPPPRFTMDQMMSRSDQKQMGIDRLSQQEQIAFEAWLNIWTVRVVNHMLRAGCRCSAEECLNSIFLEAGGGQPSYREDPRYQQLQPKNRVEQRALERSSIRGPADEGEDYAEITQILRGGALIRLDNGTVWEVGNYDRNRTGRWQRYERVELRAGIGIGDLSLYNVNRRESVLVRRPGEPERITDPFGKDYYKSEKLGTIQDIREEGRVIILDNGLTFTIPVGDRTRYTSKWRIGTVVEIDRLGGLNPWGLRNLDNGDQVRANQGR